MKESIRNIVVKSARKAISINRKAGRTWNVDECWEVNVDYTDGGKALIDDLMITDRIKDAKDWTKYGKPDYYKVSELIDQEVDRIITKTVKTVGTELSAT
ncbi:hypothetical protein RB620_24650 [Paenibacillus sp. LHD-117]|uniref:hypothetical protein n=1 Tax=Paenibacillus sp. LHD-117 TaxID=3071412 RepID=UPI0027E1B0D4|nr:hypothetical protein [Paenibacillus sp. LHD-117]MDQ6422627.1 hypothetical protein [Paenibacillus sp. LHD-117]